MNQQYIPTNKGATISSEELQAIDHDLERIEDATAACNAIYKAISFLTSDPIERIKRTHSALAIKGSIDQCLEVAMGDWEKKRMENIKGLISAIDIISEFIDIKSGDIAVAIEAAVIEQREAGKQ